MRLIRNLICAGTLVLAVSAFGAKPDDNTTVKNKRRGPQTTTTATAKPGAGVNHNVGVHHNANAKVNTNNALRERRVRSEAREHNAVNAEHVNRVNRNAVNEKVVNRTVVNRERIRNVRVINNWHTARFANPKYVVFNNYVRTVHPSWWWHQHYNRVVFINGGWYAWNDGWWIPAWGYAPGITFAFDGPIYGYNGWTPDRVTMAVQQRLADDGYYDGPIDGQLGTYTRQAIAAYQEDHGLLVTSAIDEPTLDTLGVA